jgi:chromosome segregation ATPase
LAEYQKRFDSSLADLCEQVKTANADKESHTARVTFMEARLDLKVSNLEASIANGLKTMSASKLSGNSPDKQPRLGVELEDKIKETTSLLQVDLAALREEMEGVRRLVHSPLASGDLSGDQSIRRHEIDALREEIKRLSQELSEEKVERARSIAGVCNHAEEVVQHGLNSIGVKDSAKAESNMKQIASALKKLDVFSQERGETIKTVAEVRNELEDVMSRTAELRNSIDSMKAVSEIFGNDIGELRHQCQEVRASARTDAERLTSGLAQLSAAFANSTSASPRVREGGSGSDAMGAVDQIRSDQEDINAQMHDMRTSFESDIQDLQSRLTEVTRLAQEFPARGPISGVLPASAEDRLQNLEGYVAKTRVNQERLDAIFDLAQVMTHGTEKLAKRLHSETAMWKSAKLQNDVRLSRIEKCFSGGIFNVSEGSVGKESVETRPQDHEPEMKEDTLGGTANTVRTNSSGVDTPS